jgi:hypothetical protein
MEPENRDVNGYPLRRSETIRPLNVSWPLRDKNGWHARGIDDQPKPIEVTVRILWPDETEELLQALAIRWNKSHVFCVVSDPRIERPGIWVQASDVKRRP